MFLPSTASELLELRRKMPRATLWAGGTGLMSRYYPYPYPLSRDIISLCNVPELSRISRTERYLDIGAAARLDQVLTVGHHILPPLLAKALREVGPSPITGRATIGGNLCIPDLRLNLAGALSLFSVQVELRGDPSLRTQSRQISLNKLYRKEGGLALKETEVLTRIRIAFEQGDFQQFHHIGFPYRHPDEAVIFCVFVNHGESSISDFRFSLTFPSIGIFRDKEIESLVISTSLPLKSGEIQGASMVLKKTLQSYSSRILPIQHARAVQAFERSLTQLNTRSVSR